MIEKIKLLMKSLKTFDLLNNGKEWVNLATLGSEMKKAGIRVDCRLKKYFESLSDTFEIFEDYSAPIKISYVRLKESGLSNITKGLAENKVYDLTEWAYLFDTKMFLETLRKYALDETWTFNNDDNQNWGMPILWSYIRYTFCRLQHQNKVVYSIENEYAAFNTGLVDKRYLSIIALFKRNKPGHKSEWLFDDFVIAGEGKGKIISNKFDKDIKPATYTDCSNELIYDVENGDPVIDYEHIFIRRLERLPLEFLRLNTKLDLEDINLLEKNERAQYYELLRNTIKSNSTIYRALVNRMGDAIELAIKRVRWNYKNAVPMFYPKRNKMCFLLPLCLIDDDKEDLALVVNKTPANKYEGVTILPLDLAYTDARVVARPNSEWLDVKKI